MLLRSVIFAALVLILDGCSASVDLPSDRGPARAACADGEVDCGGHCVDTQISILDCGACGNVCEGLTTCRRGACVPPPSCSRGAGCFADEVCAGGACCRADQACGSLCCTEGRVCSAGRCVPRCDTGADCPAAAPCCAPVNGSTRGACVAPSGGVGEACSSTSLRR